MADLPHGMTAEIELSFTLKGPAEAVMRDVRRLREPALRKSALIKTLVFRDSGIRRRGREPMTLPAVMEGDAEACKEQVDRLVRQTRITGDQERALDELIGELAARTAPDAI